MGSRVKAAREQLQIQTDGPRGLIHLRPRQPLRLPLEERIVVREERVLIGRALSSERRFLTLSTQMWEMTEREAGDPGPHKLVHERRLKLSRENPTAGSLEIAPMHHMERRLRGPERVAFGWNSGRRVIPTPACRHQQAEQQQRSESQPSPPHRFLLLTRTLPSPSQRRLDRGWRTGGRY